MEAMAVSKYNFLWEYVRKSWADYFSITFEEIQDICEVPIDHSFLKYKAELTEYGYEVAKISMKAQKVIFNKLSCWYIGMELFNCTYIWETAYCIIVSHFLKICGVFVKLGGRVNIISVFAELGLIFYLKGKKKMPAAVAAWYKFC